MSDEFYLQDSRTYVGNDVMFWAKDGKVYTTDLRNAQVYSKEDALAHHNGRNTDIPWPKAYIDGKSRPAVDMQYINRDITLADTGIVIAKPKKHIVRNKCNGCGKFLSRHDYCGRCPSCDFDNRP